MIISSYKFVHVLNRLQDSVKTRDRHS
jgi:hypothetical protein